MNRFSTAVAFIAALAMIAVSAFLNYLFQSSMAPKGIEAQVLGGVSVAADAMKAVLPVLIVAAFIARRWVYVLIGSAVFAFIIVFSLTNAMGFAAKNRHLIVGEREALAARYAAAIKEHGQLEAKRRSLADHRPAEVLAEMMRRAEQSPRWRASNACTNATANASRALCEGYFALKTEHALALLAVRLDAEITRVQAVINDLRDRGAALDADAQVSILADLLGIDKNLVRTGLIMLAALLVEIGSGLGLYLAVGHAALRSEQDRLEENRWRGLDGPAAPSPAHDQESRRHDKSFDEQEQNSPGSDGRAGSGARTHRQCWARSRADARRHGDAGRDSRAAAYFERRPWWRAALPPLFRQHRAREAAGVQWAG